MTRIFNFAMKIKGGGREGGTCEVLRPCHPPKFGTCTLCMLLKLAHAKFGVSNLCFSKVIKENRPFRINQRKIILSLPLV